MSSPGQIRDRLATVCAPVWTFRWMLLRVCIITEQLLLEKFKRRKSTMRNLKKILALVLALVMTMSLVTVASAATEDVSANYAEAVEVLQDMGVFQGYEDGTFGGKNFITREEVATVLYRIISKDVNDAQKGLYVEACDFEDVAATRWSAGFIGYCANGGYVKGYSDSEFGPADKVTGYQVLAMILRAVGYDKNDEFTGANWYKNVAATAQQLGILKNVKADVVLSQPATRELVAELIFRTIATVKQVTYTPAFSYQPIVDNVNVNGVTLGWENFGLTKTVRTEVDEYGRPGYFWTYNHKAPYATAIEEEYSKAYTTAVTECTISSDSFWGYDWALDIWVNGDEVNTAYAIQAADQLNTLGAQGRLTEVYEDRLVMIDTFLAKVKNVSKLVTDSVGHVITPSYLTLEIYDKDNSGYTTEILADWYANWNYVAGQYLLVNALTDGTKNAFGAHGTIDEMYYGAYDIVGVAETFAGKQTILHYNIAKHTIDGVAYDDNTTYNLDAAKNTLGRFNWYKDQYGNIIGSTEITAVYTYGVINHIQWFTQAGTAGYAQATLTLMDGTTTSVVVTKIDGQSLIRAVNNIGDGVKTVSTEWTQNNAYIGEHLYRITDLGNGTVALTNVNTTGIGYEETGCDLYKGDYSVVANGVFDSNTKFLFGYYNYSQLGDLALYYFNTVAVTGFNNISTHKNSTVDYVDVNNDGRIDYVYVLGFVPSYTDEGAHLFYLTSNPYIQDIEDTECFVLEGFVDGVAGKIYIANDADGAALVEDIMTEWAAKGRHAMFTVATNQAGLVFDAEVIETGDIVNLNNAYYYDFVAYDKDNNTGYYKPLATRIELAINTGYAYYDGDILVIYDAAGNWVEEYDVTYATRVFGDLEIGYYYGTDYSDYVIHIVYDETYGDNDIIDLYIYQKTGFEN